MKNGDPSLDALDALKESLAENYFRIGDAAAG